MGPRCDLISLGDVHKGVQVRQCYQLIIDHIQHALKGLYEKHNGTTALRIEAEGLPIYAYLLPQSTGQHDLLFSRSGRQMSLARIASTELVSPFKYLTGSSESQRRILDLVIKYGLLRREPRSKDLRSNIDEFVEGLIVGLRKIKEGKEAEVDPDMGEAANENRRSRFSHGRNTRSTLGKRKARSSSPEEMEDEDEHYEDDGRTDYDRLISFLEEEDSLDLLDKKYIPNFEDMTFVDLTSEDHNLIKTALPKKLLIGKQKEQNLDIFAYIFKKNVAHYGVYFCEIDNDEPVKIPIEDLVMQDVFDIFHPFDKCVEPGFFTAGNQRRITSMVKWYFIATEIAKCCILKESKCFPEYFLTALRFIQMHVNESDAPTEESSKNSEETAGDIEDEAGSTLEMTSRRDPTFHQGDDRASVTTRASQIDVAGLFDIDGLRSRSPTHGNQPQQQPTPLRSFSPQNAREDTASTGAVPEQSLIAVLTKNKQCRQEFEWRIKEKSRLIGASLVQIDEIEREAEEKRRIINREAAERIEAIDCKAEEDIKAIKSHQDTRATELTKEIEEYKTNYRLTMHEFKDLSKGFLDEYQTTIDLSQ